MFLGIMSQKIYLNRLNQAPKCCRLNHDNDGMMHDFIHAKKLADASVSGLKHGTSFGKYVGHVEKYEAVSMFKKVGNDFW